MMETPQCQLLNKEETEELEKKHSHRVLGFWQVGKEKFFFPYGYGKHADSLFNLKVRKSDKWIITFPRSGTTWVQELVWLINNDLNYEEAAKKLVDERIFFIERNFVEESYLRDDEKSEVNEHENDITLGEQMESFPSPRFIKTHLPIQVLPPELLNVGCKIVYIARNPKDVLVSYYHIKTSRIGYSFMADFRTYWNFARRNLEFCCPYFDHVKKAWSLRNNPNFLFLFYEEMKTDLPAVIRKVSNFYGRPCTEEEIKKLAQHLDIESFRKNPTIGTHDRNNQEIVPKKCFVRKGQIGGWKELLTPEIEAEVDEWIAENLRDSDLVFPHIEATWNKKK